MAEEVGKFDPSSSAGGSHLKVVSSVLNKNAGATKLANKKDTPPPTQPFTTEQHAYLTAFVQHYAHLNNYAQAKDLYDNQPDLIATLLVLLATADAATTSVLMQLLMIFTRSDKNQQQVAKVNGITTLINVLKKYSTNVDILDDTCRALINVGANDKNRRLIAVDGGLEAILECLKLPTATPSLVLSSIWTVRNVAVNDSNKKLIQQKGGVELFVAAMSKYSKELIIQEQACFTLMNISLKDDVRESMVKEGSAHAIASALKAFPNEKKLQEAGAWALNNLAHHQKSREILREQQCIEALVGASNAFGADSEIIQKNAGEAISIIAESTDTPDEEDDDSKAGKGVPASVAAAAAGDDASKSQTVVKKGWLSKQGGTAKSWKKRWIVLDNGKITYFKTQDEGQPLGAIALRNCAGVLEDPGKKNCILIVTQIRTYRVVTSSKQETTEWIQAIKDILAQLPKPAEPAPAPTPAPTPAVTASTQATSHKSTSAEAAPAQAPAAPAVEAQADPQASALGVDFFSNEEKTPIEEVEAVLIEFLEHEFETKLDASWNDQTTHADLAKNLAIRKIVTTIFETRLAETAVKNFKGEPVPGMYDAIKLRNIAAAILPGVAQQFFSLHPTGLAGFYAKLDTDRRRNHRFEAWGEQGIRKTMEDRHLGVRYVNEMLGLNGFLPSISIYGIFDGHGGTTSADYAASHLFVNLLRNLDQDSIENLGYNPLKLEGHIRTSFVNTNHFLFDAMQRKGTMDLSGSTGVVAVLVEKEVYICWAGDSEAALIKKDGAALALTWPTHKASSEAEIERIEKLGGVIHEVNGMKRLNGVIAVTRSFGDTRFQPFVTADPDILRFTQDSTDDALVLACDGLWDVFSKQDVSQFIFSYRAQTGSLVGVSTALSRAALERGSTDNVSVLVVEFN